MREQKRKDRAGSLDHGDKETETLFREVYRQEIELPEALRSRITVRSCIAHSEKQQVYLAEDKKGRRRILKVAGQEKIGFLRRDANILKQARFSFLPRCLGFMEQDGKGYLLREYIEGDTLWEWVNKRGPFRIREANEILCRLCGMTGQLHQQKPPIIHRDIKPQNIVLTDEKELFMVDMGTARKYKENSSQDTSLVGSGPTAAPEQYGYRQTDGRSDIYALGMLYLFLLTGGMNVQELRYQKRIPPSVRRIIGKCTRLDPDDRYQSCGKLERAIRAQQRRGSGRGYRRVKGIAAGRAALPKTAAVSRKDISEKQKTTHKKNKCKEEAK